jgi:hypothetical protein
MRTVVKLQNSNCVRCLDLMSTRLRARPLVSQVHVDASSGCLVVDHDHDDPAALIVQIHDDLRGWELADNGERVMVYLDVHQESECPAARNHLTQRDTPEPPTGVAGQAPNATPAP